MSDNTKGSFEESFQLSQIPSFILLKERLVCNKALLDLLGFEEGGLKVSDFWSSADNFLSLELDSGTERTIVTEFLLQGGELLPVKILISALEDGGNLVQLIHFGSVVNQFHSQRLETLGRLASGVVHDFNNVLAGILGHTAYLRKILPDDGKHVESLKAVEEGSYSAAQMTQQILNFARLETGAEKSRIDLREIVLDTCGLLKGALSPQYVIRYEVPDKAVYVNGIEGQLAQVIVNLVMNSRDASPPNGEIVVSLTEGCQKKGEKFADGVPLVSLSVTDKGEGIPGDVLEHIFEPFFSTKEDQGTGLGLATVYSIVDEAGGELEVDSKIGEGTKITCYFPLLVEEGDEVSDGVSEGDDGVVRGNGERILVVDDEDGVRKALVVSLEHLNYSVTEAIGGQEALEILDEESFDLILIDMLMPKMSGEELFFKVKENNSSARIMVMSGFSSEESIKKVIAGGAVGFVQKPFTIESLASQLADIMEV